MITFIQFVAELLQQCQDGMITELEVAQKIAQAADGKYSSVTKPTNDYEALGIDPPTELPPVNSAMTERK